MDDEGSPPRAERELRSGGCGGAFEGIGGGAGGRDGRDILEVLREGGPRKRDGGGAR